MSHKKPEHPAAFGTLLGLAPGNVPAYSSDYESVDERLMPDRQSYRNYIDGVYMGYKWQCVEFARRWLFVNFGYVFSDVPMAYDIFELRSVKRVHNNTMLPLNAFRNGSPRRPVAGCLIVWGEGGDFGHTGHVAIVCDVLDNSIRIAEQNFDHLPWPERRSYARELPLAFKNGGYTVTDPDAANTILGWVMQTDDNSNAEPVRRIQASLMSTLERIATKPVGSGEEWLDSKRPELAAYVGVMGGHRISQNPEDDGRYYWMSQSAESELKRVSNELHAMFMHATHSVLSDDKRLARFNIPQSLWAKLHQSWDNRRNQTVAGRLDFSMSERGLKVYEYNADSASCLLESSTVQGAWAEHFGVEIGDDPGADLIPDLVDAWRDLRLEGAVHLMRDNDPEEAYHALHMQSVMQEAGLRCKLLEGLDQLSWNDTGEVVDADGETIRWVWKTWAWETALDEIRRQLDDDERFLATGKRAPKPRLADVLLRKGIMVFEPFWTAIPSNKAILPVLWELFPDHPNMLESAYELTPQLQRHGYVTKPIGGRCGRNISIVDREDGLIAATKGRFEGQALIYQKLFPLPKVGPYYLQHSAFIVDGSYSGSSVRVDASMVMTGSSEVLPTRIVADDIFLSVAHPADRSIR